MLIAGIIGFLLGILVTASVDSLPQWWAAARRRVLEDTHVAEAAEVGGNTHALHNGWETITEPDPPEEAEANRRKGLPDRYAW